MPYPQEIKDAVLSRILAGELTVLGASRQYLQIPTESARQSH